LPELAAFTSLLGLIGEAMSAVVLILSPSGKPEKDISKKAAKKLIGNTTQFMNKLQHLQGNFADDILNLAEQKTSK
jgi:hypothetical protein